MNEGATKSNELAKIYRRMAYAYAVKRGWASLADDFAQHFFLKKNQRMDYAFYDFLLKYVNPGMRHTGKYGKQLEVPVDHVFLNYVPAQENEDIGFWDQISGMTGEDRIVLVLYFFWEMDSTEIAQIFGLKGKSSVMDRLHRALDIFVEQMGHVGKRKKTYIKRRLNKERKDKGTPRKKGKVFPV